MKIRSRLVGFTFDILFEDGSRFKGQLWGAGGLLGNGICYRWEDWVEKNGGRVPIDVFAHLRRKAQRDLDVGDCRGFVEHDDPAKRTIFFKQGGVVVDVLPMITEGDHED